jgi:hypothetical protein
LVKPKIALVSIMPVLITPTTNTTLKPKS